MEEGLLHINPLSGMKCPSALTRQRVMTEGEFRSLLRASRSDFKVFLFSLWMTGCRPKEARLLTWDQVLEGRWVLRQHKTSHQSDRPRVIYLTPPMRRLMVVLRRRHEASGATDRHVFLNGRGQPWTRNAVRLRVQRVKRKLNLSADLCCYLARHAFGTSAVLNGVDALTVAQLMGHTSLGMVQRVYCHLGDAHAHLHQAAERATRRPAGPTPPRAGPRPTP